MSGASMDLKNRIATSIDLSDTLSILFLVDVARRLHVPKIMVLDWQQSGVFCGHECIQYDDVADLLAVSGLR